jgi:hypothetical protein
MLQDFGLDFAHPMNSSDVLDGFDFDSFLQDNTNDDNAFTFDQPPFVEGAGEIGAD